MNIVYYLKCFFCETVQCVFFQVLLSPIYTKEQIICQLIIKLLFLSNFCRFYQDKSVMLYLLYLLNVGFLKYRFSSFIMELRPAVLAVYMF